MDTSLLWHILLSRFSDKVRRTLDYNRVVHRRTEGRA
jgi:hypothetical protein